MMVMVKIMEIIFHSQTFIFSQNVNTEIHSLSVWLVTFAQAFAVVAVAVQAPCRYFGFSLCFRSIIVMEATKLIIIKRADLCRRHVKRRRSAGHK